MKLVLGRVWTLVRTAVVGFINDNALTHAAAMAFYAATSLAPILLIVIAVAGLAVGRDAAQLAVTAQLTGLLGPQVADLLKSIIEGASNSTSGVIAASVALITLIASASGVFGEMQSSLNQIWKVEPTSTSLSGLVRARAASLGLVASLGFLLLVSLAASAAISGLGGFINSRLPFGEVILSFVNTIVSLSLVALLFAGIYKVLPDRSLAWRDVRFGAVTTAVLFTIGKSLIGWYLGTSAVASSYGAAGSLIVLLLWVFYSSSIFLLGAELTRAYATSFGTRPDLKHITTSIADDPIPPQPPVSANSSPFLTVTLIAFVSALTTAIAITKRFDRTGPQ
ncbi:YihY/virulence factor BrkB family protein [Mesorhizobium sp. IMUNJ 23232]|uniref:YihY/virulence factor BrkB family protein n=1 Tax=Mesorhizobium sp. IMUNJ 23232 TaxID=3376064 RepID=UPI0037AAE65F